MQIAMCIRVPKGLRVIHRVLRNYADVDAGEPESFGSSNVLC